MPAIERVLKEGYWDRTSVVRGPDGLPRVRKESKQVDGEAGPWAREALRREIAYLREVAAEEEVVYGCPRWFPTLLDSWDDDEQLGYEIPFYESRESVSDLVLSGRLDQAGAEAVQQELSEAVLSFIHRPLDSREVTPDQTFGEHMLEVMESSIETLEKTGPLKDAICKEFIILNDRKIPGLARSLHTLRESGESLARLNSIPPVRLHGDLILENILWHPLLLIDPVSVAGLAWGPPLFDLVKYEAFASGELFAIREELAIAIQDPETGQHTFQIHSEHSRMKPFRQIDLRSIFRSRFEEKYGEVDTATYDLVDAYFSLVMARNTSGTHQRARILKACACLADVLDEGSREPWR